MNKKIIGYNATVKFKDTQEEHSMFIKVGSFYLETATEQEIEEDENVFYYVEREEDINRLMNDNLSLDFIVLEVEPVYDK